MESKRTTRKSPLGVSYPLPDERAGFDVTCVVGHVTIGDGELSPTEAAFLVIARHGADGLYSFPGPAEGDIVTVEIGGMSAKDYFSR